MADVFKESSKSLEQVLSYEEIWEPVAPARLCFPCASFEPKKMKSLNESRYSALQNGRSESLESVRHAKTTEDKQQFSCGCVYFKLIENYRKSNKKEIQILVEKAQEILKSGAQGLRPQAYSKPSLWKRMYRKLRAETKQVQIACCEGICWPTKIINYNTLSYEKNFDNGQEYWHQYKWEVLNASRGPSLWQEEESDMCELALKSATSGKNDFLDGCSSPFQRRKTIKFSAQPQDRKVWFAD